MKIAYYQTENFNLSKEEELFLKFLKENHVIRPLIIEKLYKDCFLEDIKENKYFLNELKAIQIFNKLISKYTLKEVVHSLFINDSLNKQYFNIEISNIFNLLNKENRLLINKFIIEKVLEERDTIFSIEYCVNDFFKLAEDLNIENKNALYFLKSKFHKEELITNDNLNIIHI